MAKIGYENFCLSTNDTANYAAGLILPSNTFEVLKCIATPAVVQMTLRAVDMAKRYDCRHPFWNAIADTYKKIPRRFALLQEAFPDIIRVIHAKEVNKGDIVVSDYYSGMNFGELSGGFEPTKICICKKQGDVLAGTLLDRNGRPTSELLYFKNEIWYLVSDKNKVTLQ